MASGNGFTPTERRILTKLEEQGRGLHSKPKLQGLLNDDMADDNTLSMHLTNLRKKLRLRGETVHTVNHEGATYYQLSRIITDHYDGRA